MTEIHFPLQCEIRSKNATERTRAKRSVVRIEAAAGLKR
jgi:hypothetical protein